MVNDMEDKQLPSLKEIFEKLNEPNRKRTEELVKSREALEKVNEQLERIGDILEDHWNVVGKSRRKYFEKTPHF